MASGQRRPNDSANVISRRYDLGRSKARATGQDVLHYIPVLKMTEQRRFTQKHVEDHV